MSKLKEKLMLSEKGYSDLKKAITACTITNIALLLPSMVACLIFWELLKPFTGEAISWAALWKLLGLGLVAAILVFLAAKNDYRKTYIASYKEASTTRLRIAEHLRKLPMSFFNTKDLSDITTNMMADCSSMESMLSSTIPPLIANIISVTLTCVCLAFFDWRMALAIFCTMPVTFLIIWCGRKLQLRLFDKQVDVKLEASSQIQEYLEGKTQVCAREIWEKALGENVSPRKYQITEINDIIAKVPGWKKLKSPRNFEGYGKQRGFQKTVLQTENEKATNFSEFVPTSRQEQMKIPFD